MSNYRRVQFGFGPGGGMPPVVKNLLIANGIVYVLQMLTGNGILPFFGLIPRMAWGSGFVWQFGTYMFLHGGLMHIALNMYALYIFGSEIERMWGSREFLKYYLITGIGAGLFYTLLNPMSPIPTIGASGAIAGILVAFAMMFPDRRLTLLLFFVLPVSMSARTMAIGFAVISLLSGAAGARDGIAHFAHLGGMVIGWIYLKRGQSLKPLKDWFYKQKRERNMKAAYEKEQEAEKLRRMADAILDKANAVGFDNLTKDEKLILKRAAEVLRNEEKYGQRD